MPLLTVANLEFHYGDRAILNGVNLSLEMGDHIGLVGRNGCGKSTLMKLIAGLSKHKPDAGQIQLQRSATAGYLSQHHDLNLENTLREEAGTAFAEVERLHKQLENVAEKMGDADPDELDKLMKQYERLEHDIEAAGGYAVDHIIEETLHGLGLTDELFNIKVGDLSGGQRGRLALAKLLLAEPDLLLLDEPTNHLDIPGRQWLEQFISNYRGAVILISHDRWLLDRCVKCIYEMENGQLVEYPGNYQKFRQLRKERFEALRTARDKQQTYIKQQQSFIDRYRAGQRSKQAQGRESRLDRYKQDLIELPQEFGTMKLRFNPQERSGDIVLDGESLKLSYGDRTLFQDITIRLKRGERLGVIGPNGAGKSTIVRVLLDEQTPDEGKVRLGANLSVGYFRQTHDGLDLNQSVVQFLQKFVANNTEQEARDLAGAFLFSGQDQDKYLSVLSGGERGRAVLASLMIGGHNLLVLDEPSNHLDIPAAERLEEAIQQFTSADQKYGVNKDTEGTLVLISHDRMLLDNTVNRLLIFDGKGGVEQFDGTYHEYLETLSRKKAEAAAKQEAAEKERQAQEKAARKKQQQQEKKAAEKQAASTGKGKSKKQKQKKTNTRFGHLSLSKIEARIEELETRRSELDQLLADPETYKDQSRFNELHKEHETISDELQPLEEEWASRADS